MYPTIARIVNSGYFEMTGFESLIWNLANWEWSGSYIKENIELKVHKMHHLIVNKNPDVCARLIQDFVGGENAEHNYSNIE